MIQSDLRTGDLIGIDRTGEAGVVPGFVLIGCPVDEGVIRNGGRPGASHAPPLIRKHLYKMTPPADRFEPFAAMLEKGLDLGDVTSAGMEEMQQELADRIAPWLREKVPVIVLGGGHETSYGHYLGYRQAELPHHIINFDAHSDVRPLKKGAGHSGSPFRQILEDRNTFCRSYYVMGLQPNATARDHLEFIQERGGDYAFAPQTDSRLVAGNLGESGQIRSRIMVSIDMDVLDQSVAPGVSAPCQDGIPKTLVLDAARMAGKNRAVASIDLVEINPFFDRDDQTSRLGALIIWNFLYGLSVRAGRA